MQENRCILNRITSIFRTVRCAWLSIKLLLKPWEWCALWNNNNNNNISHLTCIFLVYSTIHTHDSRNVLWCSDFTTWKRCIRIIKRRITVSHRFHRKIQSKERTNQNFGIRGVLQRRSSENLNFRETLKQANQGLFQALLSSLIWPL